MLGYALTFIISFFLVQPLSAELPNTETTPAEQPLETSVYRLYQEADDFIGAIFTPLVLPLQQLTDFQHFSHNWTMLKDQGLLNPSAAHIAFEHALETLKKIYITLELVTLSQKHSKHALWHRSLSTSEYQSTWLTALTHVQTTIAATLDTKQITQPTGMQINLFACLPPSVQHELSPYFPSTDTKLLGSLLTLGIADYLSPTFVDYYISSLQQCHKLQQSDNPHDAAAAQSLLSDLIKTLSTKMPPTQNCEIAKRITQFFTAKLCYLKQHCQILQRMHELIKRDAVLMPLFVQFQTLTSSDDFLQFYADATTQKRSTLDACQALITTFFNNENCCKQPLFAYQFQQAYMAISYLKRQEVDGFNNFIFGSGTSTCILTDLILLLEAIEKHIPYTTTHNGNIGQFFQNLLGGNHWLVQQVLQYVSPLLLTQLLNYLAPHLSQDSKEKLFQFFNIEQPNKTKPSEHQALIDFANQHPERTKQICQDNSEIATILANELGRVAKPQS